MQFEILPCTFIQLCTPYFYASKLKYASVIENFIGAYLETLVKTFSFMVHRPVCH